MRQKNKPSLWSTCAYTWSRAYRVIFGYSVSQFFFCRRTNRINTWFKEAPEVARFLHRFHSPHAKNARVIWMKNHALLLFWMSACKLNTFFVSFSSFSFCTWSILMNASIPYGAKTQDPKHLLGSKKGQIVASSHYRHPTLENQVSILITKIIDHIRCWWWYSGAVVHETKTRKNATFLIDTRPGFGYYTRWHGLYRPMNTRLTVGVTKQYTVRYSCTCRIACFVSVYWPVLKKDKNHNEWEKLTALQ